MPEEEQQSMSTEAMGVGACPLYHWRGEYPEVSVLCGSVAMAPPLNVLLLVIIYSSNTSDKYVAFFWNASLVATSC